MLKVIRPGLGLLAAAIAVAAAAIAAGAAPRADEVTLRLQRVYNQGNRTTTLRFSGTIAAGRANEYVAVLQRPCGSPNTTAIAGGSTRAGGVWEAETYGARTEFDSSTYWARWENRLSDPLVFRGRVPVSLTALSVSRYRVTVSTTAQSMNGKRIELQRLVGGSWRRVSVATLRGRAPRFTAMVVTKGRNLTYRVHVPAAAARPCYSATSSNGFVVGRPPAPGSGTVIDRSFLCTTEVRGGVHKIEVRASAGTATPPYAEETFGLDTFFVPDGTLAAGSSGAIQFNPKRCAAAAARPSLSAAGLRGGAVTSSGTQYECEAPARVLVRLRAAFRAPTKFESVRPFGYPMQVASGEVKEASLLVVTPAGRRLAFASIAAGKARLHAAATCGEDDE